MGLTVKDFGDFFAETHAGARPFAWQRRLLDAVLGENNWPDQVVAPTGAGKTAVIDVHVFAQALTADDDPRCRPPRRLAMVVGRRVLVDGQHEHARLLARKLSEPESDLMREVAERLWRLRPPRGGQSNGDSAPLAVSPLVVGWLRGGQSPSRYWRDHPNAAAVLCATPDMWGSRLLFRGYGSSFLAWPREAGLLAIDSVVVVDEAHLARQLLCSARRVGQLAQVAEGGLPGRPLSVVQTTATPAATVGMTRIGVEPDDLDGCHTLTARLTRPKPIRLLRVAGWDSSREPQRRKVAAAVADAVEELRSSAPNASGTSDTIGCFVNTVHRAVDLAGVLRERGLRVVLICGQVRPHDLERLRLKHPGVLDVSGSPDVDVIVTTQALEVGVDLDLAGIVTELASASALVQRAGRVNRRGIRDHGLITVVVPDDEITDRTRSGPYSCEELSESLEWLRARVADSNGLSPWQLRTFPPPRSRARRRLYQRPELADAWHWARTSDRLAAEPELDLWLTEDFETDTAVSFVVRRAMPSYETDALRLVRDLPPQRHEEFSVPIRTARMALRACDRNRAERTAREDTENPTAVVVRGDEVALLEWNEPRDGLPGRVPRLRPGDIVVLDDEERLFTASTFGDTDGFSPPVVSAGKDEGAPLALHTAPDVLEGRPVLGSVVLRLEAKLHEPGSPQFTELASAIAGAPSDEVESVTDWHREVLKNWLRARMETNQAWAMGRAALDLLEQAPRRCEIVVHRALVLPEISLATDQTDVVRVLVRDRRQAVTDEDLRQVFSPSGTEVTLTQHQNAVAARAEHIGARLGLPSELVEALRIACAHHDDGKGDDRFQARLGRRGTVPLAKSRPGIPIAQAQRNPNRCGLPAQWRHEQLSVAESWDEVHTSAGSRADPLLVARLIGTSHGHGRSSFPQAAAELVTEALGRRVRDVAIDLFDLGAWDELVERTQRRYGVWGCAYLEALLRAADSQVSEEGS